MAVLRRSRSRSEACCKELITSCNSIAVCMEAMILELVALADPVMPVGDSLPGRVVIAQWRQLGQRYGKLSLGPGYPHPHVGFARRFGRHPQHLDFVADVQRRAGELGCDTRLEGNSQVLIQVVVPPHGAFFATVGV